MIRTGHPSIAICDSCGLEGEVVEARNPKRGTLTAAFLPKAWRLDRIGTDIIHRCGECVAASERPFEDRRDAFEARLEQLGTALTVDIASSLGVPLSLGRRWAAEWQARSYSVEASR